MSIPIQVGDEVRVKDSELSGTVVAKEFKGILCETVYRVAFEDETQAEYSANRIERKE